MHGPSATPLLVELATVALALAVSLAHKPLARLARPARRHASAPASASASAPASAPRITARITGARDHS
jgi:hypothetical protein